MKPFFAIAFQPRKPFLNAIHAGREHGKWNKKVK